MVELAPFLAELACGDNRQRFRACEALSLTIWAAGLNGCETVGARREWQAGYAVLVRRLAEATRYDLPTCADPDVSSTGVRARGISALRAGRL